MMNFNKPKLIIIILAMMILATSLGFTNQQEKEMAQIIATIVNLREEPSTESNILDELVAGTSVEVLAQDGNWYRVLYKDMVGYIREDFIFVNSMGTRGAYVNSDDAVLRGGPDGNAYLISTLDAGQGVRVKALIGEWYYITVNTISGYIHWSFLEVTSSATASFGMLKQGMEGEEVKKLQTELYNRGFLSKSSITGKYLTLTRKAVVEFQSACGLAADGVAGVETLDSLYDSTNKVKKSNAEFYQLKGSVVMLDWFEGGSSWLAKGAKFTVTDVRTGKSFRACRFGGWYHADCEPLTKADTAVMKSLEGFSWNRRPIWITYKGKTVAASMHTMPHMGDPIPSNNFRGHFCIHLKDSKVHENSKVCPRHQRCVQEAYRVGK